MDFALNDEQQDFKDRARAFARDVIRPAARKHDEEESTPWEVSRRLASRDSRVSRRSSAPPPTPTARCR